MPMKTVTQYRDIRPYTTKDGSVIRELMHPDVHGNRNLSLAEATVQPGSETVLHMHTKSEEIYHITQGDGVMTLGSETFCVATGDTVCISPGTPHKIQNTGKAPMKILCSCSPPYSHDDTELLADDRKKKL